MMFELSNLPLEVLRVSPFNLRTPDDGTPEFQQLLASIEANGVLEPLVVEPSRGPDGPMTYDVLQGGHRLLASRHLARLEGCSESDHEVPCQILTGLTEAEAREVALATTVIRRPLHPVDEFEAFATLEAEGCGVAAIARRFGLAERQVKQRLALGSLCPEARERWRAGEIDFDAAAALTQAGDFERQRHALATLRKERQNWWRAPDVVRTIRRVAAEGRVRADQSGEWRYAEAEYRAAGGAIVEDLFSDEVMIENVPLLKQVAKAKALAEGEAFQKEHGFGACFFFEDNTAADAFELTEIELDEFEPLPEEQEEFDRIEAAESALPEWSAINDIKDEAARERARQQRLADQKRLNLEQGQAELKMELRIFKQETDCTRHAVGVRIRADGELDVSFGYAIPGMGEAQQQDAPERKSLPTTQDKPASKAAPEPKGLAESHRAELAVLFCRAVSAALRAEPQLALPILLASLHAGGVRSPLDISAMGRLQRSGTLFDNELRIMASSAAADQQRGLADAVASIVQIGPDTLSRGAHAGLMALLEEADTEFQQRIRALFDTRDFFGRAPREIMEEAVRELVVEGYRSAAPKKEMLPLVTAEATRRGWLPRILRTEKYALLEVAAAPPAKKTKAAPAKAKPAKGRAPKAKVAA